MSDNKALTALVGFGAGLLVGGAAALLYAPSSGRELRKRIRDEAEQAADRTKKRASELAQVASERATAGTEKVGSLARDGMEAIAHRKEAVRGAVAEGKAAYERELERLSEAG